MTQIEFFSKPAAALHEASKSATTLGAITSMSLQAAVGLSDAEITRAVHSDLANNFAYELMKHQVIDRSIVSQSHDNIDRVEYRAEMVVIPRAEWKRMQSMIVDLLRREGTRP